MSVSFTNCCRWVS